MTTPLDTLTPERLSEIIAGAVGWERRHWIPHGWTDSAGGVWAYPATDAAAMNEALRLLAVRHGVVIQSYWPHDGSGALAMEITEKVVNHTAYIAAAMQLAQARAAVAALVEAGKVTL